MTAPETKISISKEGEYLPWFKVFRKDLRPKGRYGYMDAEQIGLLVYLMEMADGDGTILDCSVNKLSLRARMNRRAVSKCLAVLKSKGTIYMTKTDAYHFTVILPLFKADQYERLTDKPSRVAKVGMNAIKEVRDEAMQSFKGEGKEETPEPKTKRKTIQPIEVIEAEVRE